MANHEQDGIGDEDELFSEMLSGDAPKFDAEPDDMGSEPAALEPVEKSTRERDEFGRFKSKASDTQDAPAEAEPQKQVETPVEAAAQEPEAPPQQPPAKEDDGGNVPSWRVREINEKLRDERKAREESEHAARTYQAQAAQFQQHLVALQQQLQALQNPQKPQQPQTPPNMFEDPDGFTGHWDQRLTAIENGLKGEFQREIRKVRLESNLATTAHLYKEEFPEALQAFEQAAVNDQALKHRVFGSADPGGAIVAWHKERKALQEIGGDPTSYVQRKLDEALKDPAFLAKALEAARAQAGGHPVVSTTTAQPAARPNTVTQLPPSLRSVPGSSATADSTGLERMSEDELFNSIAR